MHKPISVNVNFLHGNFSFWMAKGFVFVLVRPKVFKAYKLKIYHFDSSKN